MAETPLAKKLKLTGRKRPAVIGAPDGYSKTLGVDVATKLSGKFDWVQLFVRREAELAKAAEKVLKALEPASLLWVSFPKGSSKIQTDLTRDKGWDPLRKHPLKWITLVSIDDTWSAFAVRPLRDGEVTNW